MTWDSKAVRRRLNRLARWCGGGALAIGVVGLCGWAFHLLLLASVLPGYKPIAISAAVLFVLLGMVQMLIVTPPPRAAGITLLVVALFATFFGFSDLVALVTGADVSIEDQALRAFPAIAANPLAHISPVASVLVWFIGMAQGLVILQHLARRPLRGAATLVSVLGMLAVLISLVFFLGYVYRTPLLYGSAYLPIAWMATLAALLLGTALVATAGETAYPLRALSGPSTRARLLRAFLPFMLLVLLTAQLVQYLLSHLAQVNPALSAAVITLVSLLATGVVVMQIARIIGRQIDESERALQEREDDLNRAQAVAHTGSWRLDIRQNRLQWSAEACHLLGVAPEAMLTYASFLDTVHPDDRTAVDAAWQAALHGAPFSIEHRIVVDGAVKWVLECAELEHDAQGVFISGFGTVQDITAQRQATAERERLLGEVQRRAAELEAMMMSIIDGLVVNAPDSTVVTANATAQHLLQMPAESWTLTMRARWQERRIYRPDGAAITLDEFPPMRALHGERVTSEVLRVALPEQADLWLSLGSAPIRMPDGQVLGAVTVFTDVTELHNLQEQERLILHTVAHDLRAPATIIKGQLDLLLELLTPEMRNAPVQHSVEALRRALQRMSVMIDDLTQVTQLDAGGIQLHCVPLRLDDYLPALLQRNAGVLEMARIAAELPDDVPAVSADPVRLERILLNLLLNAQKYSPVGAPIHLSAARHGDMVAISVSDAGVGIPPEDLPHVFDRFFRSAHHRQASGIGLGLYITRAFVEAHGGHIAVESVLNCGSTFTFTLPMA